MLYLTHRKKGKRLLLTGGLMDETKKQKELIDFFAHTRR